MRSYPNFTCSARCQKSVFVVVTLILTTMVVLQLDLYRTWFDATALRPKFNGSLNVSSPTAETSHQVFQRQAQANLDAANTTVVTAFFDLGSFRKGAGDIFFTTKTYENWCEVFKYIMNPVIVYTDSDAFADIMRNIRKARNETTKIIVIHRNSSWAFNLRNRIAEVYSQKGYPKHHPNTVLPEYACSQIAKYDVIARAAHENTFNTRYFMWLDIGYFRDRKSTTPFRLHRPPNFNETMVAMSLILFNASLATSPDSIFRNNLLWIGGGLLFANSRTVLAYEGQFKHAVEYFLSQSLMNTDQQIIYAMFSVEGRRTLKPAIEIQLYKPPTEYNWFYLGYLMLHEVSS